MLESRDAKDSNVRNKYDTGYGNCTHTHDSMGFTVAIPYVDSSNYLDKVLHSSHICHAWHAQSRSVTTSLMEARDGLLLTVLVIEIQVSRLAVA